MNATATGQQELAADNQRDKQLGEAAAKPSNPELHSAEPAQNGHRAQDGHDIKMSPTIGKLVEALAKAQLAYTPIQKNVENAFYSNERRKAMYADLSAIMEGTQKALAANGLVIIQANVVQLDQKRAGVFSILAHSSGEWYSNETLLPATGLAYGGKEKFDAQTIGIAFTYARRYSYQALAGVSAEGDYDANGIAEPGAGSTEKAKDVAAKKLAKAGVVPAMFYTHYAESDTYEITGTEELKTENRDVLKKFWNKTSGTLVCNGEQLEALKYEFEQRKVEFRPLKAK
jgi:hypothetical protein